MNNKILGFVVVIIIVAGVVAAVVASKDKDPNISQGLVGSESEQTNTPPPVMSAKKGIKQFTLTAVGGSGVTGDGTITLKSDLTSLAARLVTAAVPAKDEKYEVYITQSSSSAPIYAGEMFPLESKTEKFLWGGAGKVEWYEAKKIVITRRASDEAKPGKIVAEGEIPTQGQPVN